MARMKTFFTYLVLLIGFFLLSIFLENGLINNMYAKVDGKVDSNLITDGGTSNITIAVEEAKASNVNGNLKIKITNTSGHFIEKCCARVDLYSRQNLLAATKYIELNNFEAGETRNFEIKFKAKEIARYEITLLESAPDKSNIINILGWEFDLSNVFGMDLTGLKKYFTIDSIKSGASTAWQFAIKVANSLPTWAWLIAAGIVIWHTPKGFLFGIFPF